MGRLLQYLVALVTAVCFSATAFGQNGNNDEQDAEFRFSLRLTAALNNDPEAQYQVAEMYEQGTGTPQNLRMAHLWYNKSAKQGYQPAIEKLENWEKKKLESENQARERAEQQKRRQAETEAAAVAAAAKAAREEAAARAARERAAEEQKRIKAEASAKAAREEAAAAKAARERAAEEQKRLQVETAAAAAAKAAREEAARTAPKPETVPVVKETPVEASKEKSGQPVAKDAQKDTAEFRANPCNTPTAKFMSVCQ